MSDAPKPRRHGYLGLFAPITILVLVLALIAWTVWWFVVADRIQKGVDDEVRQLRRAGYTVMWSERDVSGWPFETFVRFQAFRIVTPAGAGVSAPELDADAETFVLGKWVIAAPRGMMIERAQGGAVKIDATAIRASVSHFDMTPPLISVQLWKPLFTPVANGRPFPLASANSVEFHTWAKPNDAGAGAFRFVVDGGRGQAGGVLDLLSGGQPFLLRWDGVAEHLDRARAGSWPQAVHRWTDAGGDVTANDVLFVAGETRVEATSPALTVSSEGRLVGDVNLTLTGNTVIAAVTGACRAWNVSGLNYCNRGNGLEVVPDAPGEARGAFKLTFDGKDARFEGQRISGAPKIF
jgi:hypothetical protein